ncbi:MAG: pyruvate oxidase [Firmicutes bacterium]|nr:pyruvate oxidase [Bacillota bacterium]
MNVATFLLRQLAAWGVKRVYGVIGDAIIPLMDQFSRQTELQFIPVRHESAAGFMAAAEAKLDGSLGVCIGTSGPGLANLINGIADAYADRVPLLVVSGQVASDKVGSDTKQYVDQQAMVQSLAGYSALLAGPGALPAALTQALKVAIGEGRVAHLSVPKDYWMADVPAEVRPPEPFLTAPPVVEPGALEAAAAMLRAARRPLMLAGHGSRPGAGSLLELAETWGAGVMLALGGKGMVPGDHPQVLGGVGQGGSMASHRALAAADLLFVAGSSWWPAKYMPQQIKLVQLDRSGANIGLHHPVDLGLPGESGVVLPELLRALQADPGLERSGWVDSLSGWKREWQETLAAEARAGGGTPADARTPAGADAAPPASAPTPVHPAALVQAIERVAATDAIITLDTGEHLLWFNRHFAGNGQRILFSGTWRSMGFGLPAASAAKLCRPDAPVIALVGDGGLTTLLGELAVPIQEGLAVTVVVSRNGALGLEAHKARSEGFRPFGHELRNPDFAAVARAFGWHAWRVDHQAELDGALSAAVMSGGPALVDVHTANDPALFRPGNLSPAKG